MSSERRVNFRPSVVKSVCNVARYYGVELEPENVVNDGPDSIGPSIARIFENSGLWARTIKTDWARLRRIQANGPIVLILKSKDALILHSCNEKTNSCIISFLSEKQKVAEIEIDYLRLTELWDGDAVLVRRKTGAQLADIPFSFTWLVHLVAGERKILVQIAFASLTMSVLTVFPPILVMATVNRVIEYQSISSLVLISSLMVIALIYEMALSHARHLMMSVIGTRIDARLSIHVFDRLLQLPLEFFERNPTGEVIFKIGKVYKIRNFLTGKLLSTMLDLVTIAIVLPIMFYINPALSWLILAGAVAIGITILTILPFVKASFAKVTAAENRKYAVLGETIAGIKTIKSMAMEQQRSRLWDEKIADSGMRSLEFDRLSGWTSTLVMPIDRFMTMGTLLIGAYWATFDVTGVQAGTLFGFMMLSYRVAGPLSGIARLLEDVEEVSAAVAEVGSVLNRPREISAVGAGIRPKIEGEIIFQNLTFIYPGTASPALKDLTVTIEPGTLVGVVGKSGSGKSTVARLLQGINREYSGLLKVDGCDMKDIDIRYLRSSFGVVLQENFLFRGTIRENIIADRRGLTFSDAIRAAKLSGALEFIERMPSGFETYIEEGSPNLSGGQRQRIAIARALINDPKLLILDEATSALDPESEAIVNDNLLQICKGRTTVIISHRLSSLVDCDRIMVLDNGVLQAYGRHSELLETCEVYVRLWNEQNRTKGERVPDRGLSVAPLLSEVE